MILIFCREYENTIIKIVDWLDFFNKEYRVFTERSNLDIYIKFINGEEILFINDINVNDVKAIYYRNGEILSNIIFNKKEYCQNFITNINNFLLEEWNVIRDYLFEVLKTKKNIGSYTNRVLNKIYQLKVANECGLKVPNTIIGTNVKHYKDLKDKVKITKPLNEIINFSNDGYSYLSYTKELEDKILENKPSSFFPSLVQERIDKKYELRIFFLKSTLYPMAIISYDNEVDIREGNFEENKRAVPYKIDEFIRKKIIHFIEMVELNTGSIDMIVSKEGEYFFLEVNPCGQFEYLSKYCNYQIEKEIVKELIFESI